MLSSKQHLRIDHSFHKVENKIHIFLYKQYLQYINAQPFKGLQCPQNSNTLNLKNSWKMHLRGTYKDSYKYVYARPEIAFVIWTIIKFKQTGLRAACLKCFIQRSIFLLYRLHVTQQLFSEGVCRDYFSLQNCPTGMSCLAHIAPIHIYLQP